MTRTEPASTGPLTAERILEATEGVLRRHGAAKATVVDVARALGVSHASVYRHFRTKAALREAVTKRWLDRTTATLAAVAGGPGGPGSAERKLRDWLTALFAAKRHKAGDDPQLFATYEVLLDESSTVVEEHIGDLVAQLTGIIEEGVRAGEFTPLGAEGDAEGAARAVFDATSRFHDPAYAPQWSAPGIEDEFTAVVDLILRGLRTR
ncbi:TetR family transcriptional regulator [Streptomyces sp. NPDC002851]